MGRGKAKLVILIWSFFTGEREQLVIGKFFILHSPPKWKTSDLRWPVLSPPLENGVFHYVSFTMAGISWSLVLGCYFANYFASLILVTLFFSYHSINNMVSGFYSIKTFMKWKKTNNLHFIISFTTQSCQTFIFCC